MATSGSMAAVTSSGNLVVPTVTRTCIVVAFNLDFGFWPTVGLYSQLFTLFKAKSRYAWHIRNNPTGVRMNFQSSIILVAKSHDYIHLLLELLTTP